MTDRPMRRPQHLIIAALASVVMFGPAFGQSVSDEAASSRTPPRDAEFDAKQTKAIEDIVREYLIRDPEVLVEAGRALQAKYLAEQEAAQAAVVAALQDQLRDVPEGAILGNPEGDVTVVEFFDYNCGYCERALDDMDTLLEQDPNLRFILQEMPVLGPGSVGAARVSLALRNVAPSSYGDFHRDLLAVPGTVDEQRAIAIAEEHGVPASKLETAMNSPEIGQALEQANIMANQLAITGTPGYVVGDAVLHGAVGIDLLKASIDNVRACGRADCK